MAVGELKQFGRTVIYTDAAEITKDNILEILREALPLHAENANAIEYLWKYYKGYQPILDKTSETRPEINHTPVENHANEIVTFKSGYLMGEPVQYVTHGEEDDLTEDISKLNEYAFAESRPEKDRQVADWFHICGTAYKMILTNNEAGENESPFRIYVLDPRTTFVVYSAGLGEEPKLGVTYTILGNGSMVLSCYTKGRTFKVVIGSEDSDRVFSQSSLISSFQQGLAGTLASVTEEGLNVLGDVPIIEYPANAGRQGAFEIVLPLLDEINDVLARRMDGLDRFVEAYMIFKGVDFEEDELANLRTQGAMGIPADGAVEYVTQELKQDQIQTLADTLYQRVLDICGMPNRNGGHSTSDNGIAVIYRDGWSTAEAHAKGTEGMFKLSENRFLRIALNIANAYRGLNLKASDIEIRFSRRNYENILQKAQVLTMLLSSDKVAPRLAYAHCGLFVDPDVAYLESEAYTEALRKQREEEMRSELEAERERSQAEVYVQSHYRHEY